MAGLILLFLLMRRVPKVSLPGSSVPGFGGTSPVTVSLANGLGMIKAAKQDTVIELSTSAGSITGSVTIPKGQQHAQAVLTSSNECGPVKITAKADNKTGTAKVSFNCGPLSLVLASMPESLPADGKSTANVTIRTKDQTGRYVAMIEERTVHLTASLGSVATPVKIPARAMAGSAVLTAGKTMGVTVINATSGAARGECKIDMSGSASRYCMYCGSPMAMEDGKCRKCGNMPPSGVDVKECPNCSTVIPEAAKFCYKCGAVQPVASQPQAQPVEKK